MTTPGDAQAASEGLSEQQAIEALEARLAPLDEGDSEGDEAQGDPEREEPDAEAFDDGDEPPDDDVEEQSGEDEEDEDGGEEQPQKFRVKVEDQEFEVTQDELIRGYQREQDYSRKTMALGEERKAFEAEKATVSEMRGQYKEVLDAWAEQLEALRQPSEDLEALRQSDPGEYAARLADVRRHEEQLARITAEKQRVLEEEQKEQAAKSQASLQQEAAKLFAAIPAWADPDKGQARQKADKAKMREYAESLGFTPEEVSAIADHRYMVVLRDAAAYRALQARKPQVQRQVEAVKVARPGTQASRPSRASEVERAKQRLKATGSDRDAQAAFMKLNL